MTLMYTQQLQTSLHLQCFNAAAAADDVQSVRTGNDTKKEYKYIECIPLLFQTVSSRPQ